MQFLVHMCINYCADVNDVISQIIFIKVILPQFNLRCSADTQSRVVPL